MASQIRQRMIERTAVLLAKKGLQGTSFSEVLQASGAPRGSLYHHFPGGKDELVLAALSNAGDQIMHPLNRLEGKSAAVVAQTFIGLWRAHLVKYNFRAGCAGVAITVAADSPVLLESVAEVFRDWRYRLSGTCQRLCYTGFRSLGLAHRLSADGLGHVRRLFGTSCWPGRPKSSAGRVGSPCGVT
jgi:TetR/AcrR family transcriptional repressor of lmrAB and yxaGH operons